MKEALISAIELYLQYAQESFLHKVASNYKEKLSAVQKDLEDSFEEMKVDSQIASYLKLDWLVDKMDFLIQKFETNSSLFYEANVVWGDIITVECIRYPGTVSELRQKIGARFDELRQVEYTLSVENSDGNLIHFADDAEFQEIIQNHPSGRVHVNSHFTREVAVFYPLSPLAYPKEIRTESSFDVMIAYSRTNENRAVALYLDLRKHFPALKLLICKRDPLSNSYEGMAEAVMKSLAVVACISKDFAESPFCFQEIEYATSLKKVVIPICFTEPDLFHSVLVKSGVPCPDPIINFSNLTPSSQEWSNKVKQLANKVKTLFLPIVTTVCDAIRGWLCPADFSYDLVHYESEFAAGTCSWVGSCLERWVLEDDSKRMMWLLDGAGTGKSLISFKVWKCLGSDTPLLPGAVFFCKHHDKKKSDSTVVIATIAWQLSQLFPSLKAHLLQEMECDIEAVRSGKQSVLQQPQNAFRRLILDGLAGIATEGKQYLIVIDALDECQIKTRATLLDVFVDCCRLLPPFLKLFVTGRPEQDIYKRLKEAAPLLLVPAKENTLLDIGVFVRTRLTLIWNPPPGDIVDAVMEKAEGLFIYARNICQYLQDQRVSASTALEIVKGFHTGADSVYKAILQRELQLQNTLSDSSFRKVFGVILAVREPVSISTLRCIGNLDFTETAEIVSKFRCILKFENNKISIIHKSLYDFLTTRIRCGTIHFISIPSVEAELARNSLTLLTMDLFENMAHLDPALEYRRVLTETILEKQEIMTEALKYAAAFWGDHFINSSYPPDVLPSLHNFCSSKLLNWLELMLLLRNLNSVIPIVQAVIDTLSRYQENRDAAFIKDILSDLRILSIQFRQQLLTSPLQIYRHAMFACPKKSVIARTFESQRSFKLAVGQTETWGPISLTGHESSVKAVAFSKDGTLVVSGSTDRTIRVWLVQTGECIFTLNGVHTTEVTSVVITDDKKLVVSASIDCRVIVWSLASGEVEELNHKAQSQFDEYKNVQVALSKCQSKIAVCSEFGFMLWMKQTADARYTLVKKVKGNITCVALSSLSDFAVTGSWNGSIGFWNTDTMTQVERRGFHESAVRSVVISDSFAISCDAGGVVKVWNKTSKTVDRSFQLSGGFFLSLSLSTDHRTFVGGTSKGQLQIWSTRTWELVKTLPFRHASRVNSVHVLDGGQFCASGGEDATVKIWDMCGASFNEDVDVHFGQYTCVFTSANSKYVAAGDSEGCVNVWDLESGKCNLLQNDYWISDVRVLNNMRVAILPWGEEKWKVQNGEGFEVDSESALEFSKSENLESRGCSLFVEKDGWICLLSTGEMLFDLSTLHNVARYDIHSKPRHSFVKGVFGCILGNQAYVFMKCE
ncbi:hypothetical protein BDR26DRAFT_173654 [Obelidium mucronatum]|nr:hypothetical protein BDR26DRAFT_173654 [Obelidium mucronatum]